MQQDTRRYLAAVAILLVGTGLTQVARTVRGADAVYKADYGHVPLQIGGFKGVSQPVEESVFSYLQANAMEERLYTDGKQEVRLAMVYGTDWRSIHAPTGCFPAQGWQIVHNRISQVAAPPDCPHPGPLQVRVLDVTKKDAHMLAMFVYARPGGTTSDWTVHGWKVATGPRGAGGMIIILQSAVVQGDVAATENALKDMLSAVYPKAVSLWYAAQDKAPASKSVPDA